jgi:signal transduction histidine kinase/CheY-like chemotaxis protein/HPt (histidine-containing phosphotransfer) domain-containing protein
MGKNHNILASGHHSRDFFRAMYTTIAKGETWHGEICNKTKDGHTYWVDTTISAFMEENGKLREYIAVSTDITEHKRVEEAAHAASRTKSEFLANMSHEIRTPMNGVVGMVDILQKTKLTVVQHRMIDTIHNSSLALLQILNDILDSAKIEAGKLAMESIPTHLRELVEGAAQLMVTVSSAKSIELSVFVSPELPCWIASDPTRLRQVLLNLLGNAVKFTSRQEGRPSQITLRVIPCTMAQGHPGIQLCIIDNGIGMSQEVLANLFQPFSQADESTARKFGGTGLGLSISQRLVELMDGTISVSSTLGEGAEFTVKLPLQEVTPEHVPEAEPSLVGVHVLAVTCDVALEQIVSAYCIAAGAAITLVEDMAAAREHLQQTRSSESVTVVLLGSSVTTIASKLDLPATIGVARLTTRDSGSHSLAKEVKIPAHPLLYHDLIHGIALASGRLNVPGIPERIERPSPLARSKAPSVEEALLTGRLILLAEDNETNREVMQAQLNLLGYTAEVAEDGMAALQMWRSGNYALLLTDCHMPNMDGFKLTAAIRQTEPEGSRLPIIAVTANAMQGEFQRCLDLGMDDYLSKPLRLKELKSMLDKWLPLAPEITPIARNEALETLSINYADDEIESQKFGDETSHDFLAVWDATTLPRLVGDNPTMHHRLLEKFLCSAREQVSAIGNAALTGETGMVSDIAHKLKSAARTVGAIQLGELCQQLETAGRTGDEQACATLVGHLGKSLSAVADLIKERTT